MPYQNVKYRKIAIGYATKYPKFLLLFITFIIAYLMFYGNSNPAFHDFIISLNYFGTFISGILFSYGFTAAPATALFLIFAKEQNIIAAGLIGGFGALLGDLLIFSFIRASFKDEVEKLYKEKFVRYLAEHTNPTFKKYFIPIFAGLIIASPLPDEIGINILAAYNHTSMKVFTLLSYVLNTAGIFVILLIGSAI